MFNEANHIIQNETMLAYQKFRLRETVHVYTDASDTQLGGVIQQDNHHRSFTQSNLTVPREAIQLANKRYLVSLRHWSPL